MVPVGTSNGSLLIATTNMTGPVPPTRSGLRVALILTGLALLLLLGRSLAQRRNRS
jgi:hypothetical protein